MTCAPMHHREWESGVPQHAQTLQFQACCFELGNVPAKAFGDEWKDPIIAHRIGHAGSMLQVEEAFAHVNNTANVAMKRQDVHINQGEVSPLTARRAHILTDPFLPEEVGETVVSESIGKMEEPRIR